MVGDVNMDLSSVLEATRQAERPIQKLFPSRISKIVTRAQDYIEPLWVTGLALLIVSIGGRHRTGKDLDSTVYLLLGSVFPTLLLIVHFLSLLSGWLTPALSF